MFPHNQNKGNTIAPAVLGSRKPKVRWNTLIANNLPNPLSPAATSKPIDIPTRRGSERTSSRQHWQPFFWIETLPIHHQLDDITNYCRPGTSGWEFAQRQRAKDAEKEIGKVLGGCWPLGESWSEGRVERKTVEFEDDKEVERQAKKEREIANA
jgi:hypothetical protein